MLLYSSEQPIYFSIMSLLDNRSLIKQIDQHNYLSHILDVPEQLVEGFHLGEEIRLPALYAQAKQVVLLAAGEVAPLGYALKAMMLSYARIPVVVVDDYILPNWVSNDTLVIALDYYGTTEQILVPFHEAARRKARLVAVTVGGELAREASRFRCPLIPINYGSPARVAFTYLFSCLAQVLDKLDLLEVKESMVSETTVLTRSLIENIGPEAPHYQNSAKQLAEKMVNRKNIILIGSGPLTGVAKHWQILLTTTAKTIAFSSTVNEFNDTIINGLGFQPKIADSPLVVMLQSKYDYPRNKLQQTLTYQVAQAQKIVYEQVFMHPSGSLFGEIVLASLLGTMVSYYVALLTNKDPSVIEATAYIKEHLPLDTLFE